MGRSVQQPLLDMEVNSLHCDARPSATAVKKLHQLRAGLSNAKAKMGAAVNAAIGDQPRKAFGHEGLIAGVCAGPKVPDYLARIWEDPEARRRFGIAILRNDPKVKVRLLLEIDEE